jgi:dCMP deaminase
MKLMARPPWDTYFLRIAEVVATRATCSRKLVGAVIVDAKRRIVATGYNGAPRGLPHCDDVGHELKEIDGRESCVRTLHAESNALDYAGPKAEGSTLYATVIPCYDCAKRIANAGIRRVVYGEYYESRNTGLVVDYFKGAQIELIQK